MSVIEPFELAIGDDALDDLRARLRATRWPERETVDDWSQGMPLAHARRLSEHWLERYDWRRCERELNALGQFRTTIDGLGIHFLHIRSPEANALPLLMTHGWPGSVIEFLKVAGPLTDPVAHGGRAEDAFHLVLPSLPGFGFSDRPSEPGWGIPRVAGAWIELMRRLGYDHYVAQGGDWGSAVTTALGLIAPPGLRAIHLNMPIAIPKEDERTDLTEAERAALASIDHYMKAGSAYAQVQGTTPQTIGYGLVDSPIAQACWIYDKFQAWSDCDGDPTNVFTLDELLDNIMLYWLTATGASAARIYWESLSQSFAGMGKVALPTGCSIFPKEIFRPSRRWAERQYPNIVHWNELDAGGHFAAFEQPALFVDELRACFAGYRA